MQSNVMQCLRLHPVAPDWIQRRAGVSQCPHGPDDWLLVTLSSLNSSYQPKQLKTNLYWSHTWITYLSVLPIYKYASCYYFDDHYVKTSELLLTLSVCFAMISLTISVCPCAASLTSFSGSVDGAGEVSSNSSKMADNGAGGRREERLFIEKVNSPTVKS